MRYGIPLLANRVSPRCTIAEGLLVLEVDGPLLLDQWVVPLVETSWTDLLEILQAESIRTIVCGGIANESKSDLQARNIEVVENVAETAEATVSAILTGRLRPEFGFHFEDEAETEASGTPTTAASERNAGETGGAEGAATARPTRVRDDPDARRDEIDCLACTDRRCLVGEPCLAGIHVASPTTQPDTQRILEAALDISCEEERSLCRVAEVVYFALEMNYRRLGVAFCWDLAEPARILVEVLRRFFEVVPVGCKIGGHIRDDALYLPHARAASGRARGIACNPLGQAGALTRAGCELNVTVGLCLGADCVFATASRAPVTTLLVKDRSLAHNPIGALYSEYYLKETRHLISNET
jgi:uncharacterized metal-binding protein